jgi:hypothetical protein
MEWSVAPKESRVKHLIKYSVASVNSPKTPEFRAVIFPLDKCGVACVFTHLLSPSLIFEIIVFHFKLEQSIASEGVINKSFEKAAIPT